MHLERALSHLHFKYPESPPENQSNCFTRVDALLCLPVFTHRRQEGHTHMPKHIKHIYLKRRRSLGTWIAFLILHAICVLHSRRLIFTYLVNKANIDFIRDSLEVFIYEGQPSFQYCHNLIANSIFTGELFLNLTEHLIESY